MRAVRPSIEIFAVVLSVALGLPLVRVLITLLYGVRESRGTLAAMSIAAVVFSAPMIAVVMARVVGSRNATAGTLVGLAIAAAGVQVAHPITWWLAGFGVACALGSWTLLWHGSRVRISKIGSSFVFGFLLGLAVDTSVHASFRTWDAAWQSTPMAVIVTVILALAAIATVPALLRSLPHEAEEGAAASGDEMSVAVLGPFLVLQVLFLHNVAFAGAAAEASIAVGAAAVLAGLAVAMAMTAWGPTCATRTVRVAAGVTIVALAWILPGARGWLVLPALIIGGGLAGWLLSIAPSHSGDVMGNGSGRGGMWRKGAAATIGSLTFVTLVFAFQIHASQPLPVSNRVLPVIAAVMLGVAASVRMPALQPATTGSGRVVFVAVGLASTVPLFLAATTPSPAPMRALDHSMRIMSWNVHSAVDAKGQLVPDSVAATIAAQHPDVVVLQEVSRGWPIGGSLDLAAWLSERLDMPFVWGPAADSQFGNLVLSRAPILESDVWALPFGSGPQRRSLVRVVIDAGGSTVTVAATHLETGPGTDTRAEQIEMVLRAVADDQPTVIAGDMNMQPADDDVSLFLDAGFLSAQDEAGNNAASTARVPSFLGDRPDWVFGSPDLTFSDFTIVQSDLSDHRPLEVTVVW
jgi:endonuclease/exonuclease/phosphatase family metal-dependent hydrolase